MLLRIGEIAQIEKLPILFHGTAHPKAQRNRIRCAFIVGDVNGVTTGFELDTPWLGNSGVKSIEINDTLVVDLQNGSVV